MSDAPVVFGTSVEALVRVLGATLTPEVHARFVTLGIDLERPNPAYPYETWLEALRLAMALKWPGAPEDEATYRMGRAIFESYSLTLMGSALLQLLKVLGPRRGLERMTRNLRTTNNYSETRLTVVGPHQYQLWVNKVAFPHYFRGLLEAGLEFSGAKSLSVRIVSASAAEGAVFDLAWG
ncbi:MAG: DUF2378 family protein [Myxococcaceae bacterium]|nr:DUF2378 family protein [Myxococcaceae bacterium]